MAEHRSLLNGHGDVVRSLGGILASGFAHSAPFEVNSNRFLGQIGGLVMRLGLIVLPGRPPSGAVAVALDEPGAVVAADEAVMAWRSFPTVSCSCATGTGWSLRVRIQRSAQPPVSGSAEVGLVWWMGTCAPGFVESGGWILMPRWTCSRTLAGSACRGCCGVVVGCGRSPGTQRSRWPAPPGSASGAGPATPPASATRTPRSWRCRSSRRRCPSRAPAPSPWRAGRTPRRRTARPGRSG